MYTYQQSKHPAADTAETAADKRPLGEVQKVHYNSLRQAHQQGPLWAPRPCHAGWFWRAELHWVHLIWRNLIIYTSAPLDAVPASILQVLNEPRPKRSGRRGVKDGGWITKRKEKSQERRKRKRRRRRRRGRSEVYFCPINAERKNK